MTNKSIKSSRKPKCQACGYRCIEDNVIVEKRIHMDIKHNGEFVNWI